VISNRKIPVRAFLIAAISRTLGRRWAGKFGRILLDASRLDFPNTEPYNGEDAVRSVILTKAKKGDVIFDIGANTGEWTESLLQSGGGDAALTVHCFEPCEGTFVLLSTRLTDYSRSGACRLNRKAVSNTNGAASLGVRGTGRGDNSFHNAEAVPIEPVELITMVSYCEQNAIGEILLAKIDTEGHDLEVLRGSIELMRQRRIICLQFEYNQRWIFARAFLRDVFLLVPSPEYRIGKVTPLGIDFYDQWSLELESYREGNYLICRSDFVKHFRAA
jgi:FkbM family methyltransferase